MHTARTQRLVIFSAISIFFAIWQLRSACGGPATTQAADPQQQLQTWWDDLKKPEPWCSRALLDFSSQPDLAIAFLKEHLKPLKLDQKELDDAVKDLSSDDDKVWKPAFEKLEYFDPRLLSEPRPLIEATTEPLARSRLVEILVGQTADTLKGETITTRMAGNAQLIVYAASGGIIGRRWSVEVKVADISKPAWTRAERALVLLQHIGTAAALALLKDVADGKPEAEPTKIARVAVQSLMTP